MNLCITVVTQVGGFAGAITMVLLASLSACEQEAIRTHEGAAVSRSGDISDFDTGPISPIEFAQHLVIGDELPSIIDRFAGRYRFQAKVRAQSGKEIIVLSFHFGPDSEDGVQEEILSAFAVFLDGTLVKVLGSDAFHDAIKSALICYAAVVEMPDAYFLGMSTIVSRYEELDAVSTVNIASKYQRLVALDSTLGRSAEQEALASRFGPHRDPVFNARRAAQLADNCEVRQVNNGLLLNLGMPLKDVEARLLDPVFVMTRLTTSVKWYTSLVNFDTLPRAVLHSGLAVVFDGDSVSGVFSNSFVTSLTVPL